MITQIKINSEVQKAYNELAHGEHKYIIFSLNNDLTEIVLKKAASPDASHDEFLDDIEAEGICYAIYKCVFPSKSYGFDITKDVFITYVSPRADRRKKMVIAGAAISTKSAFNGVSISMQGANDEQLSLKNIQEKCAYYSS